MKVNILMIDDHPLQLEGYQNLLNNNFSELEIHTTTCFTCEDAFNVITEPKNANNFHMILLDRNMPAYKEKNINNGEQLALLVRHHMPNAKILILTSHSEIFVLYDILRKIEPEGLMVKSDFNGYDFLEAFRAIMSERCYYSESVLKSKKMLLDKEYFLDSFNRQIIMLLSEGIKTKNLAEHINLSKSAIEKRKIQIKDYLGVEEGGDESILFEARKLGFI